MRKLWSCCLLLAAFHSYAQNGPDAFSQKVKLLKRFFEQKHFQPRIWDDTASRMLFKKWMTTLDDEKLLFTQQDVARLAVYQDKLDDELNGTGWNFFNLSITLYRNKLHKTDSIVKQLLSKPVDLSKPDNISWPFADYSANDNALVQRWQQYLKWEILTSIADAQQSAKKSLLPVLPDNFSALETSARQALIKSYQNGLADLVQSPDDFLKGMQDNYLNAIAWCYDPHSSYMNTSEKKEWDAETSASEFTVGFNLEENDKGQKVIGYLQPGGSAWRSGQLHSGDILVTIKEAGRERIVSEMEEDELEKLLTGNSEADLEVTIRTAAGEVKTVKLTKEKIIAGESIVKSYVLHGNKNIGYINLPGFYSREEEGEQEANFDGCANDVSKEIIKLRRDTIEGLILDLRFNGGGSMWEGMQLAGIFIDAGPIASMKEKMGVVHFLKDPNRGTIYDGPLIVLVNGASASASEFVSAALQDYNRAIIVGGDTYGKGTAQVVLPMDTGIVNRNKSYSDYIKITDAKFYRVNGSTTQWKGVIPDIHLPDEFADESFKEKSNASALPPDNGKTGIYHALPALPIQSLKLKSEARTGNDPYFKGITAFTEWFGHYKNGALIPLQWNTYVDYYKSTMAMFAAIKDDENRVAGITVSNNGYDKQKIEQSGEQETKVNQVYLKNLQKDHAIGEAFKIMLNWIE